HCPEKSGYLPKSTIWAWAAGAQKGTCKKTAVSAMVSPAVTIRRFACIFILHSLSVSRQLCLAAGYLNCALMVKGHGVMIEFRQLRKTYGEFVAVGGLDLAIDKGEVFGFLGPNGAGKTTTIRMMMGILVPTSGSVIIDGLDCQSDRVEVKRRVGYLPDNPIFYDYLRGREILSFVGEMHGQSRAEAERNAAGLLGDLALDDAAEDFAANYSTGMKKKLGLACALIHDPAVLILDEPTNGLDPRASREVQDRLRVASSQG